MVFVEKCMPGITIYLVSKYYAWFFLAIHNQSVFIVIDTSILYMGKLYLLHDSLST